MLSEKFSEAMLSKKINSDDETGHKNTEINDTKDYGNKNNLKAKKDKIHNIIMAGLIANKVFSSTPSSLDLFMNFSSAEISESWRDAIKSSCVEHYPKAYLLKNDVTYEKNTEWGIDSEKIPLLYHNLRNMPVIQIDEEHSCYQSTHR